MTKYEEFFKGKKVTLMGLGLLGRGVGDAEFLAECGAHVLATDLKTAAELATSVEYLKQKHPDITFRLGGHDIEDFTTCDMVIKAAGVPLDSPFVKAAESKNIPVFMTGALFAKFAMEMGVRIVGVTGTRGKSTITHMVYHALEGAGRRAILGGNVRGRSTLAKIVDARAGDVAVLELDSWQLQGFGDMHLSPDIVVFSNLMPDHLNYYPDMQRYFNDKANIFRYQKEGDHLFIGSSLAQLIGEARPPIPAEVPPSIPSDWQLLVAGEHNRENASLAAAALRALGLSEADIKKGLEAYAGIEGRFQFVREIDGVRIINDNNATTPTATLAALAAVPVEGTVLIMGGADKGLETSELVARARMCKKAVLLAGSGTDRIRGELPDAVIVESLATAVQTARSFLTPGDTMLFSPAFASFGMFKNEYDRNDQFLAVIRSIV